MNWSDDLIIKELLSGFFPDSTENFSYHKNISQSNCSFCSGVYTKLFNVYINKKIYKGCIFCSKITNYKNTDVYDVIICKSDMDQLDIIKKTVDCFFNNDSIPIPTEIDKDAKIVNITVRNFIKAVNNDDKNILNNLKIFFTKNINTSNIVQQNMFFGDGKINKSFDDYYSIPIIDLSEKQKKIFEISKKEDRDKISNIVKQYEQRFILKL